MEEIKKTIAQYWLTGLICITGSSKLFVCFLVDWSSAVWLISVGPNYIITAICKLWKSTCLVITNKWSCNKSNRNIRYSLMSEMDRLYRNSPRFLLIPLQRHKYFRSTHTEWRHALDKYLCTYYGRRYVEICFYKMEMCLNNIFELVTRIALCMDSYHLGKVFRIWFEIRGWA